MEFGLTIPMRRKLKLAEPPPSFAEPKDGCWDLHMIELRGGWAVIAVHCATRYTAVLHHAESLEKQILFSAVHDRIGESLIAAGFSCGAVERYMRQYPEWNITKTHGRREVAFLNRAWFDLLEADLLVDPDSQAQPRLEAHINSLPCRCAGYPEKASALARMRRFLNGCGSG